MRLALIRQRYTPYGGAERFLEGALEALLERNVAITLYTREWPQTRAAADRDRTSSIRSTSAGCGATAASRAPSAARSARPRPTSCSRTSGCSAATSTAPATACTPCGSTSACAARSLLSATRACALNPYHRYVLAIERRMFASPWLHAVICNSRMVQDEIRERFGVPDERLHVDLQRRRHRSRFTRACASTARGCAHATASRTTRRCSCSSAPATSARASRPRSTRWRELPEPVAPDRRRPREAPAPLRAPARALGVARAGDVRRPAGRPEALLRRRRRLRAADALRSVPERGARGDGLRAAGRHQHQVRRRRARRLAHDAGLVCAVARRRGSRGAHAHAARAGARERAWARTRRARCCRSPRGDDAEARAALQGAARGERRAARGVQGATRVARRPRRRRARPSPTREAPPLHGDGGLANEALPARRRPGAASRSL